MIVPHRENDFVPSPTQAREMQKALETARLLMRRCVENKAINGLFGAVGHWKRFKDEAAGRSIYEEVSISSRLMMTAMLMQETASKLTPAAKPKERLSKVDYVRRMDLERAKATWKANLAGAAHEMLLAHPQPELTATLKDSSLDLYQSARKWHTDLQLKNKGRKCGPQQPLALS